MTDMDELGLAEAWNGTTKYNGWAWDHSALKWWCVLGDNVVLWAETTNQHPPAMAADCFTAAVRTGLGRHQPPRGVAGELKPRPRGGPSVGPDDMTGTYQFPKDGSAVIPAGHSATIELDPATQMARISAVWPAGCDAERGCAFHFPADWPAQCKARGQECICPAFFDEGGYHVISINPDCTAHTP